MSREWREIVFGEILSEPVRNGIYKKKEFHGRGQKIVNMGELFANSRLYSIQMKRVELNDNEISKALLKEGDLIFARRSLTAEGAGKCSIIKEIKEETTFESSIIRARPNQEEASSDFLYYYFNSYYGKMSMRSIVRQVAVAGITGTDLIKLKINLPPLPEQKAIAHILGKLDDKIELNRQMNQSLESMAQALFQSWFVDFDPVIDNALLADHDTPEALQTKVAKRLKVQATQGLQVDARFPDRFMYSEDLGKYIPEGWEVSKIGELGAVITGKTPSSKTPEHFGELMPFVTPTDFKNYFKLVNHSIRKLSEEGISNNKNRILPTNSVIITCIGSDMGKVVVNKVPCMTNQQINSFVPNLNLISSEYIYYFFKNNYKLLRRLAFGGSTMPILNKTDFENIDVLSPPKKLLDDIGYFFQKNDVKILNNLTQTQILTQLRDTLLPQLISGKLKVPAAMLAVENALQ